MAQTNGEALIAETEKYLNQTNAAQAESETTALPFETPDEYIDDPTGFSDVAAKLWNKVNTVFDLAVKYNRHSPDYLKSLAQLEKGIKFLGSCCLQKYALEMQKQVFPDLARLNTVNLYKMTAIHFNKIDRALTEYIDEHQTVDDGLLDMEYRYYNLMERLRATEVKIYNYRDNYYFGKKNYDPVIHGSAFSGKSWEKELHEHDEPMPFQRAKAFPVQQPAVGAQQPADSCQQSAVSNQQSGVSSRQSADSSRQSAVSVQRMRRKVRKHTELKHTWSALMMPRSRHSRTAHKVRQPISKRTMSAPTKTQRKHSRTAHKVRQPISKHTMSAPTLTQRKHSRTAHKVRQPISKRTMSAPTPTQRKHSSTAQLLRNFRSAYKFLIRSSCAAESAGLIISVSRKGR